MKIDQFTIESGVFSIVVDVMCAGSFDEFAEKWQGTDRHVGGVTVKNPIADRNAYKFFTPLHYKIADLASDYAKAGRPNPSGAAYASLQRELERDLSAADYYMTASVYAGSICLVEDGPIGVGFDYSYDDGDLVDIARSIWDEYGSTNEAIAMAHAAIEENKGTIASLLTIDNMEI